MNIGIVFALAVSSLAYLFIGWRESRRLRVLGDVFPIQRGGEASVLSAGEFSASTTATTVSLATVVLAYFELAPYLGSWLLWTVITTGLGILGVRLLAARISRHLSAFSPHVPSLHEFLGVSFSSESLRFVAGTCTSLGFLGALAVELTVGSRFVGAFLPGVPTVVLVILLSTVGLLYTVMGGFRAVVVSDRVQMKAVWVLAGVMSALFGLFFWTRPQQLAAASAAVVDLGYRDGIGAFIVGIFLINVPTYIADMSIWQRVGGTSSPSHVEKGLTRSVISVMVVWAILCLLAVMAPFASAGTFEGNPLIGFIQSLSSWLGQASVPVVFVLGLGLLAAMFSTASTQLIAFSHAAHQDVLSRAEWFPAGKGGARLLMLAASVVAISFVEILTALGFSISDLVFAVYGSQLGLVPAVFCALFRTNEQNMKLSRWVMAGVSVGFLGGWGTAVMGRVIGDGNMVFLAPAASLVLSAAFLLVGSIVAGGKVSPKQSAGRL